MIKCSTLIATCCIDFRLREWLSLTCLYAAILYTEKVLNQCETVFEDFKMHRYLTANMGIKICVGNTSFTIKNNILCCPFFPRSPKPAPARREHVLKARSVPESFDWRPSGFVSPVRNQASCGSCYAFSAMGMNEARWRMMTNNTQQPVFSPQDVVECSEYSQGNTVLQLWIHPVLFSPYKDLRLIHPFLNLPSLQFYCIILYI